MSSHLFGLSTFGSTLNALGFTFSSLRPCGAGVAASSPMLGSDHAECRRRGGAAGAPG